MPNPAMDQTGDNSMDKITKEEVEILLPSDFNADVVDEFRKLIFTCIENGDRNFRINFRDCDYIDSTGLGALAAIYKKCSTIGGNVRLKALKPHVMNVFVKTRLNTFFEILD